MSINFKYTFSRRAVAFIVFSILFITVVALFILSYLINENNRITNEEFARKGFYKKYEAVENEFIRIDNYQKVLKKIVDRSSLESFNEQLDLLNEISLSNRLIHNNWFIADRASQTDWAQLHLAKVLDKPSTEKGTYKMHGGQPQHNELINFEDSLYWLSYDIRKGNQDSLLWFGYSINLHDLHEYFTTIDASSTNYAYIFNKEGICISHPDEKYIGKNVFDFTTLTESDTIMPFNRDYTQAKASSEFLQLEVTRFVKPLKTKNFEGYVSVNYVNLLMDESVLTVKKYTTLIFLVAIFLIIFVFMIFNETRKRVFEEKEIVSRERNKLLIENEKIHKEQALNQLNQLKEQINPHFLFNSLNSLYMLIGINPTTAKRFTLNLSKIYRYLIHPPEENVVPLSNELTFIGEYISLQENRFSEELSFQINHHSESAVDRLIPYLALQIVVENAIKHNISTIEDPLRIEINIYTDYVEVRNNYQLKPEPIAKENFGLNYLDKIYRYHQCTTFKANMENESFVCVLPLI